MDDPETERLRAETRNLKGRQTDMPDDWTKPAAMAIPKGGFIEGKEEQGRYGPIFPNCEPTSHRKYVSASASLSLGSHEPPAHRSDLWRSQAHRPRLDRLPHAPSG